MAPLTVNLDVDGTVTHGDLTSPMSRIFIPGDFNGDGKVELIAISHNKIFTGSPRASRITLINIENKTKMYDNVCFDVETDDYVFAMDYDGDGKTDICHLHATGMNIYSFLQSGNILSLNHINAYNSLKKQSYVYNSTNGSLSSVKNHKEQSTIYGYYSLGNIASVAYAAQTGSIVTENYTYLNGHLSEIKLNNQTSIWKLTAENALGQPTNVSTGSINRTYGYSAYGLPTSRTAGSFQNFTYSFDAARGNLTYRKDNRYGLQENFTYDGLNRLTAYKNAGVSYDIKGNITAKTDMGGALYYAAPGKPYAISGFDDNFNSIPRRNQAITYTSFKRPNSITEGTYAATFAYNTDGDRVKMELKNNGSSELRRYYLGGQYELDEGIAGTKEKLYLGGDYYSAAAVYVKQNGGSWAIYYICRDYLGSITHITNSSGTVVQELRYDAWGGLQNGTSEMGYNYGTQPALFLGRGYTGHEHLFMFELINMNARLYDNRLGRFLSPDPYVQSPDFSQNFNRYSYCLNNPLRYTDPNGEFIFSLFLPGIGTILDAMCWGAVIGAGTSAAAYTIGAGISGNWSWNNFGNAVGMGAIGGALGGGFGALGSIGALGSFGNTLGYSMLNQAASSALTNTMFGNDMTWGSVAGMVAGSALGSVLPNFNAVKGGAFKNAMAEIGFNSGKGALTGFTSGLVQAGIDKNPNAIWQNTLGGAISGTSSTMMNLAFFGPAYKPHDQYYSHDKNGQTTYRKGGLLLHDGQGLTWGRSLGVSGEGETLVGTEAHESTHIWQQNKMGWAGFYGKTIKSYVSDFFNYGTIDYLYGTHGTLEWQADKAARYYMRNIY